MKKNRPIIISINSDEQIYFQEKLITINNLSRLVKTSLGEAEISLIILRADALVRHGFIINVLDELRKLKNIKIGLSTLKK